MTLAPIREAVRCSLAVGGLLFVAASLAQAQSPNPVLNTVHPAGGQAGTSVTVVLEGSGLDGLRDLATTVPKLTSTKIGPNRFRLDIPAGTPTGAYDLRAVGASGMSSPRVFVVGNRTEALEAEPNDAADAAQEIPLDAVVNGRIEKPGDIDCFKFKASAGQRVVIECSAERIDSKLRAVLELHDASGKRLASNRGHTGIDPLIDVRVPTDGTYFVKVFDLSYLGSSAHFYRLDIDTKPRVEFAVPCVVQRGKPTKVKLFGRNLAARNATRNGLDLDSVEVEITPPEAGRYEPLPLRLRSQQMTLDCFAYHYPGSQAPVLLSVTDVPVGAAAANRDPEHAQELAVPSEVCGQLSDGDERHWYAVRARRGEVLWFESIGSRLGSPVDLDVRVVAVDGKSELLELPAMLENLGDSRFPTAHADPAGRWVAPADGRYLVLVRNLTGGLNRDPRRVYRLSVRREEPDFHLAVVSRRTDQPAGNNLAVGGREALEVLAVRHRGFAGPIRVTAGNLPPGVQCPDTWIGPGQDRGVLVLSASRDCSAFAGGFSVVGHAEASGTKLVRPAVGGGMVWAGQPIRAGRITQQIPLATAAEAKLLLTATVAATTLDQESILDVAIDLEQRFEGSTGPIHLTAVGLPRVAMNSVTLPAGKTKGWISFAFPATLPPGPYTFAVQAETTVLVPGAKGAKPNPVTVTVVSNPITVSLRPAKIVLELDPRTPTKIARGSIIRLQFSAARKQGFIGKVHTELVAPDGVVGLRARGVTLVGQSDSGTIQVIATEDAPLGRHLLLRLDAVGTVEDQPVYRASRFVELEITE